MTSKNRVLASKIAWSHYAGEECTKVSVSRLEQDIAEALDEAVEEVRREYEQSEQEQLDAIKRTDLNALLRELFPKTTVDQYSRLLYVINGLTQNARAEAFEEAAKVAEARDEAGLIQGSRRDVAAAIRARGKP